MAGDIDKFSPGIGAASRARGLKYNDIRVSRGMGAKRDGGHKTAVSPQARLNLIRRVHARMVAEGKIIPPLDEAML